MKPAGQLQFVKRSSDPQVKASKEHVDLNVSYKILGSS